MSPPAICPAGPWPPIGFTALNQRCRNARIGGRGEIAQLVEHSTENRGVGGSSPPLAIAWTRAGGLSGPRQIPRRRSKADSPHARSCRVRQSAYVFPFMLKIRLTQQSRSRQPTCSLLCTWHKHHPFVSKPPQALTCRQTVATPICLTATRCLARSARDLKSNQDSCLTAGQVGHVGIVLRMLGEWSDPSTSPGISRVRYRTAISLSGCCWTLCRIGVALHGDSPPATWLA
jgi:hypothetical protein